jgi:hypothetical protein
MLFIHNCVPIEFAGLQFTPITDKREDLVSPNELWKLATKVHGVDFPRIPEVLVSAFGKIKNPVLAWHMLWQAVKHQSGWAPIPETRLGESLVVLANRITRDGRTDTPPWFVRSHASRSNRFLQKVLGGMDFVYFTVEGVALMHEALLQKPLVTNKEEFNGV